MNAPTNSIAPTISGNVMCCSPLTLRPNYTCCTKTYSFHEGYKVKGIYRTKRHKNRRILTIKK